MKLKLADQYFSKHIRKRDSVDGWCKCPLCPTKGYWKYFSCGHYIKRRHLSTRWNEDNCMAICPECNGRMETDKTLENMYGNIILDRIGPKRWGELMALRLQDTKMMQYEIDEVAEKYKDILSNN